MNIYMYMHTKNCEYTVGRKPSRAFAFSVLEVLESLYTY